MATAFLLNPPRRKRRKSRRAGSRRRRTSTKSSRRRRRRNPAAFYGLNPKRKRRSSARRSRRRSRRRNPAVAYGLNPRRRRSFRRRRSGGRRRRNPGMGGLLSIQSPSVFPALRLPLPGIVGKIANGAVQAGLGGAIVFGGYVGSGMIVKKAEEMMGATLAGKWRRPALFGIVAGVMGAVAAFAAKKLKGNPVVWAILGSAGPGLRAFGGAVANLMAPPADPMSPMAKVRNAAVQLADFVQLSDEDEMGEEVSEAGMGDFVQLGDEDDDGEDLGDELVEAGLEGEEDDDSI